MTGDTSRRLTFGVDVPCPRCLGPRSPHVIGVEPKALRAWRRTAEATEGAGKPTPASNPCGLCNGAGTVKA